MKDWPYYLLAVFAALIQIVLHATDVRWVMPNLCLIIVVWLMNRLSLGTLTVMTLIMSAILALASAAPIGFMVLSLYLVILAGRLLFHQGKGMYQLSFQVILLWLATILMNVLGALVLSGVSIRTDWSTILFRSSLEGLYNMVILAVLVGLFSGREREDGSYHRLPKIR